MRSKYGNLLQAGQFRDQILVEARVSTPIQNGPGANLASRSLSLGYNGLGVALTTYSDLVPRVKNE